MSAKRFNVSRFIMRGGNGNKSDITVSDQNIVAAMGGQQTELPQNMSNNAAPQADNKETKGVVTEVLEGLSGVLGAVSNAFNGSSNNAQTDSDTLAKQATALAAQADAKSAEVSASVDVPKPPETPVPAPADVPKPPETPVPAPADVPKPADASMQSLPALAAANSESQQQAPPAPPAPLAPQASQAGGSYDEAMYAHKADKYKAKYLALKRQMASMRK